ncbi:MAG: response regulator [Bacteroidetes bacterium]|nr:response regulator [Bacteroidota bacterium]
MNTLILEDEFPAANRLQRLIARCDPGLRITGVLDSVEAAVERLRLGEQPDLLFADIHLADGLSFDVFRQVPVDCPVIFTTAYDEYTLRAFKLNSVDYLLKPVEEQGLREALDKFRRYHARKISDTATPLSAGPDERLIRQLLEGWGQPRYRQRFLLRRGERLDYLAAQEVAFAYSDQGLTHLVDLRGHRDLLDRTLEELEQELDPSQFFRISRKCIIALPTIKSIHKYFSGRLKLDLEPAPPFEVLVSRDRVEGFQSWLDR